MGRFPLITLFFLFSFSGISQNTFSISKVDIIGNSKTEDFVIFRELTFTKGQSYTLSEMDKKVVQSTNNLRNTGLFTSILIDYTIIENHFHVSITLKERWYLWPNVIFELQERNFNDWWANGHEFNRVNYGGGIIKYNFRGRREVFKSKIQLGYAKDISITYENPFLNYHSNWGISGQFNYTTRHEIPVKSENNRWIFKQLEENDIQKELKAFIALKFRKGFYQHHRFLIDFKSITIDPFVLTINPNYLSIKNATHEKLLTFIYQFKLDKRNNSNYPTKGHYFDIELVKGGFKGTFNNDRSWVYLQSEFKKFKQIRNFFYYAISLRGKISNNYVPGFYHHKTLSGRDLPRGYDLYVVDAQNYFRVKNQIKWNWLPKKKFHLWFVPIKKFSNIHFSSFLGPFVDLGYSEDNLVRGNQFSYDNLWSYGMGLDIVSFYDTVFRLEYSRNHLSDSGIFIHFTASI